MAKRKKVNNTKKMFVETVVNYARYSTQAVVGSKRLLPNDKNFARLSSSSATQRLRKRFVLCSKVSSTAQLPRSTKMKPKHARAA